MHITTADRVQVYYRVYADDLPVVLAKPIFFNDPFLGRIQAASVTPPHTAANIKHHLCKVEGINGHARTDLFSATSNESPTGDSEHLSILENDGPGSKPSEPMGLIVKSSDLEAKSPSRMTGLMGLARRRKHAETRYLYYRLYTADGEINPKQSIRSEGLVLGRIDVDSIAPPHTVASLKRCISKAEGIDNPSQCQLFVYLGSPSPVDDGPLSILTGSCPGSTTNRPMALVYSAPDEPTAASFNMPPAFSAFTKRISSKQDRNDGFDDSRFLNLRKNEILHTDGQVVEIKSTGGGAGGRQPVRRFKVYRAVNEAGLSGFVMKDTVRSLR